MVPIAQSSKTMRRLRRSRNRSSRTCLASLVILSRTINSRSTSFPRCKARLATRSCWCRQAYGFDHVAREIGGAGWRHYVDPADQGVRLGEQGLGDLDAVLRGILWGEGGQLLADVLRYVYAGHLEVEELGLAGAAQRHKAEQDADSVVIDAFEGVLQGFYLEDRLGPEGVRPGLDLAPEFADLLVQVLRRGVEGGSDQEPRRLSDGVAGEVFPVVHPTQDVHEAYRVGIEDRGGLGVVPDLGRIARHGEDVLYAECRRPEQVGLQADDVPVPAREVGDDLDSGLVLHDPGRSDGVHPEPGPRPIRDVYGVHAPFLQPPRRLHHPLDSVAARQIHLHRHGEAGAQPFGELRDGTGRDPYALGPIYDGHTAANPGLVYSEVP